jgi:Uma2 family endonuclease
MQTDTSPRTLSAAEFEQYASLPENADRRLELIAGEVIEMVSDFQASRIAALILAHILMHVLSRQLGYVTGADGGYIVGNDRFIPDVAYISNSRFRQGPSPAWCPVAPDLAVEVLSPGNAEPEMRLKVVSYLRAGTLVWVVDPVRHIVEIYATDQPPRLATTADTLTGGDVLPGFSLAISEIFPA